MTGHSRDSRPRPEIEGRERLAALGGEEWTWARWATVHHLNHTRADVVFRRPGGVTLEREWAGLCGTEPGGDQPCLDEARLRSTITSSLLEHIRFRRCANGSRPLLARTSGRYRLLYAHHVPGSRREVGRWPSQRVPKATTVHQGAQGEMHGSLAQTDQWAIRRNECLLWPWHRCAQWRIVGAGLGVVRCTVVNPPHVRPYGMRPVSCVERSSCKVQKGARPAVVD
jgi:hypothetical protein